MSLTMAGGFFTSELPKKPWVNFSSILIFNFSQYFDYYMHDDPEKAMAPHSSTLAWKIPETEESGRLRSMGSLRVGHN